MKLKNEISVERPYTTYFKFVIPSLFGVFIFLSPVVFKEKITIPLGVLVDLVKAGASPYLPIFSTGIIVLSAVVTIIVALKKTQVSAPETCSGKMLSIFDVNWPWVVLRIMGAVFACLVFFKTGPEWLWSEETGGVVLYDLTTVILVIFLISTNRCFVDFQGFHPRSLRFPG